MLLLIEISCYVAIVLAGVGGWAILTAEFGEEPSE